MLKNILNKFLPVGSRSILFGAHCFFIHPFIVAYSWYQLYGFPYDPRLWFAFFLHDIGYIGKPNMDGIEGESHPYLGARIMNFLFDRIKIKKIFPSGEIHYYNGNNLAVANEYGGVCKNNGDYWFFFTLYHSRFLAKKHGQKFSKLCVADKLAIANTPAWFYLPMVKFTGEIKEYMKDTARNSGGELRYTPSPEKWYAKIQAWVLDWVEEHKDGKEDKKTTIRKVRKTK